MNLTEQKTVGEIASEKPAAVRVFDKYGIDYCCGGKVPLQQACRERGLAPEDLMAELAETANGKPDEPADWLSSPLGALIDHIVARHHLYLRSELPRLEQMLAKVTEAHGDRHGDVLKPLQQTFVELRSELESHMWKEEMVLFPLIRDLETSDAAGTAPPPAHCGSVNNPIRVMEHEHEAAGQALDRMRRLTANYELPDDACNTYRAAYHELQELEADLHQHIHLENNILFPRSAKLEASLL